MTAEVQGLEKEKNKDKALRQDSGLAAEWDKVLGQA